LIRINMPRFFDTAGDGAALATAARRLRRDRSNGRWSILQNDVNLTKLMVDTSK
jgi:hypothetical protein